MTKSAFLKAIQYQRNEVRKIDGTTIANVAWKNSPWLIIENEETFEDAKQDGFEPILQCRTTAELYDVLYKTNKNN